MKFSSKVIVLGAAVVAAPAAFAQTAPAAPAPAASATPAVTPAPAAQATFSDAEIQQFATAALAVEKVRKDTTIAEADKNAKLTEAVTASGLTAERFNAIAQAMASDAALNQRIQAAAAAQVKPAG